MASSTPAENEIGGTDVVGTYYKPFSVLKSLSNRQLGISTPSFSSKIKNVKLNQLSHHHRAFGVRQIEKKVCKFIRLSSHEPDSLVGVWKHKKSEYFDRVCHLKLRILPTVGNEMELPMLYPILKGSYNVGLNVVDFLFRTANHKTVLYVIGNTDTSGALKMVCESLEDGTRRGIERKFPEFVYSFALNSRCQKFAVGRENTFYLYNDFEENGDRTQRFKLPEKPGDVRALMFDEDGDILYIGCDDGPLFSFDLRLNGIYPSPGTFCPCGIEGVIDMKLLPNKRQLVYADVDGDMGLLDLRKRRPIFQYPEHKNSLYSRKFTIDDELDLVCATGDDNVTRLWSLSTGKLLRRIITPNKGLITHSCFVSYPRRWFVLEVQAHGITPIQIN